MVYRRVLPLLALLCSGCSAVIVPPATTGQLVAPVFVADYGYHSSIIFSKSDGGLIEYAYGDWTYFGLNDKSTGTALHALLISDQATLGRRMLDRDPRQSGLGEALGAKVVLRFDAPREKVKDLEHALDRRFSTHLDSIMYSNVHHLYFVKDDEHYTATHNCNHFTADALLSLGCRIDGMVLTSNFSLRENESAAQPPANPPETGSSYVAQSVSLPRIIDRPLMTSAGQSNHSDRRAVAAERGNKATTQPRPAGEKTNHATQPSPAQNR
jgi:hypothetical protein